MQNQKRNPKPTQSRMMRPKTNPQRPIYPARTNFPTNRRRPTRGGVGFAANSPSRGTRQSFVRRNATPGRKVPEALPRKEYKETTLTKIRDKVFRREPEIKEVVREPTSGGIVFRVAKDKKDIEILLIQDSKNRWTIPKGHIEPGENAKQTAVREIGEEAGLKNIEIVSWLGKIHFKYRRNTKLVLMTTQIYLVHALNKNERPVPEKWMNGIKWFSFADALDAIEYEDIEKLMLIAKKKIRTGDYA